MIPAHDSPLAALAFDASGTKLATASEKVICLTRLEDRQRRPCVRFLFYLSLPPVRFTSLSGHGHPRLLHPRGTEAL